MASIKVKFVCPASDDSVKAFVTILPTTIIDEPVAPNTSRTFHVDPGDYQVIVSVKAPEGTDWTVEVTPSNDDMQTADGTGEDSVQFEVTAS